MSKTGTAVPEGLQQYAKEVGRRLRDLPASQRTDIERDNTDRLAERGITRYDAAVVELGKPSAYADEFRRAMELPPLGRVRRRRLLRIGAVAAALALIGGGLYVWLHDPVPGHYPLVVEWMVVESPGELVGSVVRMPQQPGEQVTFGFTLLNDGDRSVRIDGVITALSVEAIGGGLSPGSDPMRPIFHPDIQITPPVNGESVYTGFGAAPSFALRPFTLQPGERAQVTLRGELQYCVDAPGYGTSDHPQIAFTVDGEQRTLQGPEMAYMFGDCS